MTGVAEARYEVTTQPPIGKIVTLKGIVLASFSTARRPIHRAGDPQRGGPDARATS